MLKLLETALNTIYKWVQNTCILIKVFISSYAQLTARPLLSEINFLFDFYSSFWELVFFWWWRLKNRRKGELAFGGDCLHPSDAWYVMLPLAFVSEYVSLFPNYLLNFLRAKNMFYTYHDLTFWTFWNSCISDILLIPKKRSQFFI